MPKKTAPLKKTRQRKGTALCEQSLDKIADLGFDAAHPFIIKNFGTDHAFFKALVNHISELVGAANSEPFSGNLHDYLFDHFMARFDQFQTKREAFIALFNACRSDAGLTMAVMRVLWVENEALLGSRSSAETSKKTVISLLFAYVSAFYAWKDDTSPDMAHTMSQLDSSLTIVGV